MDNVTFEYVASGFSYFKINGRAKLSADYIDFFKNTFSQINGKHTV